MPKPTCAHSYTRPSGMIFTCHAEPHPRRPDDHYFRRDLVAEKRAEVAKTRQRRGNNLVVVPGERR